MNCPVPIIRIDEFEFDFDSDKTFLSHLVIPKIYLGETADIVKV